MTDNDKRICREILRFLFGKYKVSIPCGYRDGAEDFIKEAITIWEDTKRTDNIAFLDAEMKKTLEDVQPAIDKRPFKIDQLDCVSKTTLAPCVYTPYFSKDK